MGFLTPSDRPFLRAVVDVAYCNPFLSERVVSERAALGSDFVESEARRKMRDSRATCQILGLYLVCIVQTVAV